MKASRQGVLAGLSLFVFVAAVYLPSVRYGFIYDDPVLFANTPVLRSPGAYAELFTQSHFSYLPYYRPVARATFELQKLVHGARPGLFHLFNALAAGALALAAWRVLLRPVFRVREPFAWLGAALFAVLPVASSTVYPPTGRETLLSSALLLCAVASFLRPGGRWLALAALAFATGLLCHEQAIVLPALLIVVDAARGRGEEPFVRRAARHVPLALVALVYLVARSRALAGAPAPELALFDRPSGPLISLGYALTSIFAPPPGLVYEPPLEIWATPTRLVVAGAATTALLVAVVARRKELGPVPLACAAWLVIALAPSANVLVQETPFAERWICLGSFGVVALCAALASTGKPVASGGSPRSWPRSVRLCGAGSLVVIVVAASFSVRRGFDHADNRTFLTRWVVTNPESAQARSSLGALLHGEGDVRAAEVHLRRAIQINPAFADAHGSLGALLLIDNRLDEALPHLELAARLNPSQAIYQANLGSGLGRVGRYDEAERCLVRALQLEPGYPAAQRALTEVRRLRREAQGGG